MASHFRSKQEQLWRGEFGDAYTDRNSVNVAHLAALTTNWVKILHCVAGAPPRSILEVGANVGLNFRALRQLTDAEFFAVEPNVKARERLLRDEIVPRENIRDGLCSAIPFDDDSVDLAFTSGVLIHVGPDDLQRSCAEIYRVARRYIICIEYFADQPQEVVYRGETGALFKRDFGGFYLDNYPDLRVLDYGFAWKRTTGLDNLTWWVLGKRDALW